MNFARVQIFEGCGKPLKVAEAALPDVLREGEVLVRIGLATICGSDLHTVDGRRSAPVPCVLGHEAVGRVVASQRADVAPGRRVTWTLADSCGRCMACIQWQLPQKCERLFKYGHAGMVDGTGLNGCYATHILLRPGTAVFEVPEALPDAVAAPANCALATIINALETLPVPCDRALVQGAGLLGLYACAWLRHRGVAEVFCTDVSEQRLAVVEPFGGVPLAAADIKAGAMDIVLEVTGASAVVPDGIRCLRPGGHYVWAGMVHPETQLDLTGEAVLRKCLVIRGVHNYAPRHLKLALEFLAANPALPFEQLVSPALPLDQLNEALALSRTRRWQRVAIQP